MPYYTDALLNGYRWGTSGGTAVTYSFSQSVPNYYAANAAERSNFIPMNTDQQAVARSALTMFSNVASVTFTESSAGSIRFGTADLGSGIGGWAYYPRQGYVGPNDNTPAGDVWITNRYASFAHPVPGRWEYQAFIHEVGHALGLKHPGNYDANGGGTDGPYLPAAEDNHQYTVMSYSSGPTYSSLEPRTLQLYDIAALQQIYGANLNYNSGNTVYSYAGAAVVETIWDGGGVDTLDASAYTMNQIINLDAGSFSSIGGVPNNIAIAFNCVIENATGGSGNDLIRGNSASNILRGGSGNDVMQGGLGNDLYEVTDLGDVVTENFNEGIDRIYTSVNFTLPANVENLVLVGNAAGTGNDLSNNILAIGSGNNTLLGRGGNDMMQGGLGDDIYEVTDLGDIVIENPNEGIDRVYSSVDYTLPANVEDLMLVGNAGGIGNNLDNNIRAIGTDNNILVGRGGIDTLQGGPGNDLYEVTDVGDLVIEFFNEGTDRVYSTVNYTLPTNVENLVLVGTANGTGNSLSNEIIGSSVANVIDGGGGIDILSGGAGNDTFVFRRGEANNDAILDFNGNGDAPGDSLTFVGYGTSAQGATLNRIDTYHWTITSWDHQVVDTIGFLNGASLSGSDILLV